MPWCGQHWGIVIDRPPTLLFPGSVGHGIPDPVFVFVRVGSPATELSCQRSLLLLCWTATASLTCASLFHFTNNRDTTLATRYHREASSWGESKVGSLMLASRSRIKDLGGRFSRTRSKFACFHVGSKQLAEPVLAGWIACLAGRLRSFLLLVKCL